MATLRSAAADLRDDSVGRRSREGDVGSHRDREALGEAGLGRVGGAPCGGSEIGASAMTPHPPLRGTLSRWERDRELAPLPVGGGQRVGPSPGGRGTENWPLSRWERVA